MACATMFPPCHASLHEVNGSHKKNYQVEHICKAATPTSLTGWELSHEEVLLEKLQGECWLRLYMGADTIEHN
eukprot:1139302-Pelagomonas_calceolata.AAC.2